MSTYGYIENSKIIGPVNMRSRFKDVGAWHTLSDEERATYGWYPCVVINEGYDTTRQSRSSDPELTFDEVESKIIATYSIVDKDIETVRINTMDNAREERRRREETVLDFNGMKIRTDSSSQQRIAGLVSTIIADQEVLQFDFEAIHGQWVTISREDGLAIGKIVSRYVQGCFSNCRRLHALIQEANTIDDILSIDLMSGWPI